MKTLGHKDIKIKQLEKRIRQLEAQMGAKAEAEYDEKIKRNSWHDSVVDELFPVVKEVLDKVKKREWTWTKNWDCKYINVRVDMRDGGSLITNRNGEWISPDQLKYQYKQGDEE